ncbi:MAG: DEAD/DEAH box helicase [Corynebacterium sp.]|nr:DEAD/DEAH box helicase [Corynebacterium sp.]
MHGFWTADGLLRLWIEDTATRKTINDGQVLAPIPVPVLSALSQRGFTQRVRLAGKKTGLFTTALVPQDAVRFLDRLLTETNDGWDDSLDGYGDEDLSEATAVDDTGLISCPFIAPDLAWLLHLWEGVRSFCASGRILPALHDYAGQTWPEWEIAPGAEEQLWLTQMNQAAPGILHAQYGLGLDPTGSPQTLTDLTNRVSADLCTAWVRHQNRKTATSTPFGEALMHGQPFEATLGARAALAEWADSLSRVTMAVVIVVEENNGGARDGQWRTHLRVRLGDSAPVSRRTLNLSGRLRQQVEDLCQQAIKVAPILVDAAGHTNILSVDSMIDFIENDIPRLEEAGFHVMLPRAWTVHKVEVAVMPGAVVKKQAQIGFERLVEFDWRISVGSHVLSEFEMEELIRSREGVVKLATGWVRADKDSLARAKNYLEKYRGAAPMNTLRRLQLADPELRVIGDSFAATVLNGTMEPTPMPVAIPDTLHAELRPYQQRGVEWLMWMYENDLGALIADDMGLGKTIQVIAFLLVAKQRAQNEGRRLKPSVVVAPSTVVANWAEELARFAPSLKVCQYHGSSQPHHLFGASVSTEITDSPNYPEVVLTSYNTFLASENLQSQQWHMVIADEAQKIKNPSTKTRLAVTNAPAEYHVAMTGTPVENSLVDLWSIMDFINPGAFGTVRQFRHRYKDYGAEELRAMVGPFMIRREKSNPELLPELPQKNEILVEVNMTPEQASLYAAVVREADRKFVLNLIYYTKAICNHPAAYLRDGSAMLINGHHRSGKVKKLQEIIDKALLENKRVLIFTQIIEFGQMLQSYLSDYMGEDIDFLYGAVTHKRRRQMISRFQAANHGDESAPHAFIISSLAGGVGINLTAASIVVHMDRWWNPAVENQATDRAYRMGQKEDVTVYKMITRGSIEESINDILTGKVSLASETVPTGEGWITQLSPDEINRLFKVDRENE